MSNDIEQDVEDRLWGQGFDELTGRCVPPDRREAILQQVAGATARRAPGRQAAPGTGSVWAAALLLLGLSVAAGVAVLVRAAGPDRAGQGPQPGSALAGTPAARAPLAAVAQEPQPGAVQDPKPAPKPAPKPEPQPAPAKGQKGTHQEDLAATRSVEAMREAERRLARRLKEGKLTGFDRLLPFDDLGGWPYKNGLEGMPERIRQLAGKKVLMIGCVLPIDTVEGMQEFLLVKSLWSCCLGKPPDINDIVRCVMPKGKTAAWSGDPVQIVGTFHVEAVVAEGHVVDIFQIRVESVGPVE